MRFWFTLLFATSACNSVFYQGDRKLWYPPDNFGLRCITSYINAADHTRLAVMHCPAKSSPAKGVIIQFHGNAQNMTAHYRFLSWLLDEGYSLTTFDYRGYGESEQESSREGIYLDAQAFLQHVRALHQNEQRIFYGQSLGGAVLMRALLDEGLRDDEIYIFEGTFLSYRRMARSALASRWFLWPWQFLAYVLVSDTHAPGRDVEQFAGRKVILIHGEADPVVPIYHGEEIAELMRQPLWRIAEGKHLDTWHIEHGKLRQVLLQKLQSLARSAVFP